MRDLVALSTLAAAWVHANPREITESLSEVLLRMLRVEFVYARVPFAGALLEAGRIRSRAMSQDTVAQLRGILEASLKLDGSESPRTIPDPGGQGELHITVLPIGHDRDCGWLVAASRRPEFPDEHDRLLLGVAINQLVLMLQHKLVQTRLAESDRRKDEFLAMLAHELRNPLAPMRSALRLVELAPDRPDLAAEAQAIIKRQVEQIVRLVDDLLDLSRISVGKIELRRESVDLDAVLKNALETVQPLIRQSEQVLEVSTGGTPLVLDADPVRLAQVISNLLNNASKFTPRGGRVALTILKNGGEVEIGVRDTGIGIPADMLPRVFEMFTQVDSSLEKSKGGLGIGLTIVKRLVELHGGTIGVRSEGPGMGSEFTVRLPLPAQQARAMPLSASTQGSAERHARRVVVVDDNADAASSLALLLEALGHEATTAADGPAGLIEAHARRPDVVFLDIGMPGMSGYDACKRIRSEPWGRDLTLVALSGWGQEEHKTLAKAAGFDHHFVKPVDLEALDHLLQSLPGRSRSAASDQ